MDIHASNGAWSGRVREFGVTHRAHAGAPVHKRAQCVVQCIVVNGMNTAVRSLVLGAAVEVVVFLSVIPKDSMQPPTRSGAILA
jgi:hypothetical protein